MRSLHSRFSKSIARVVLAALAVASVGPTLVSLCATESSPLAVETTYAQSGTQSNNTPATNGANGTPAGQQAISVANGLINAAFMFMNPILMLASWLLSPDWTYGDFFGMRPILHKMWVMISNIVYVIFAVALLVIAVLNIFGASQSYQIKTVLPKFVGGIILVPLSWFIVSAVLSIANILTASVLNLPYDTFTSKTSLDEGNLFTKILNETKIPNDCIIVFDKSAANGGSAAPTNDCKSDISLADLFGGDDSPYSILYVYAYGIFKVDDLQKIKEKSAVNNIADIAFGLFTGILGFIVMFLLFIGIVFVLFTRAMYLWVFIILSPLFGLFVFLGKDVLGSDGFGKYNLMEFIKLAMVPVYIAASLSFGMMLVLVVAKTDTTENAKSFGNDGYVQITTVGKDEVIKVGRKEGSQLKLTIIGSPLALGDGIGKGKEIGKGTIGKLLVMILALMILWLAVMAGAKSSKITEAAIKPIEDFGTGVGGTLTKLPQFIPIIPTGDGKTKMAYAGFTGLGNQISGIGGAAQSSGSAFGQRIAESVNERLGGTQNPAAQAAQTAVTKLDNPGGLGSTNAKTAADSYDAVLASIAAKERSMADAVKNAPAMNVLATAVEKMKPTLGDDAAKIAKEIREARSEVALQLALKKIEDKLPEFGRSAGLDWNTLDQAKDSWTAAGGATPTPSTTPYVFTPARAITITGANADTDATSILANLPTNFTATPDQLQALRAWIGSKVSDPVKQTDIINALKTKDPTKFWTM